MLKSFEVEGFKNFGTDLKIDFSDVRDYKFNANCVTDGLLSKIIIYGKNSVGKSNLGLGIFDIVSHLTANNVGPNLYDYYLNTDSGTECACFRYTFQFDSDIIVYAYSKDEKRQLINEQLYLNDALVFDFNHKKQSGVMFGLNKISPTLNWDLKDVGSVFKYFITNTALPEEHSFRKMYRFISNMLWFRSLDENRYIGYRNDVSDYYDFAFEKDNLSELKNFLHKAGIKENLVVKENIDGKKALYFDSKKPMPFFKVASSGTKALYTFFFWYKTAKDISLMFIDEFDAFYHYELAESIVDILEKMPNTQVMLTSHNTNLLSNRIMRPDCYFILSDGKLTSFANATNRELREGHNLEKLYMSGEFNG